MFATEAALVDALSEPTPEAIAAMGRLRGDIVLLGVAGKMGPTLARMARRASDAAGVTRRVIGVSRFTSPSARTALEQFGIETIACDLLDEDAVARLPDAPNVVYMAGMKFGATGNESQTWAMNAHLPAVVCRKYRDSRIVAFSTGNVYGLSSVGNGGSHENDPPQPVGEYAMSCLGRERMFEHFSRTLDIPVALIRLNYACDLRYGVLVDLAHKILAGEPVDVTMGNLNAIWQADANAMTLQAFDHVATPPRVFNVTGPELLSVRTVAERLSARLGRPVRFAGTESGTALVSNTDLARSRFAAPRVSAEQLIDGVADWVRAGGRHLGKPTHFESRDGQF